LENTYIEEYFMSNTFYKYENNLNKKYNCTIIWHHKCKFIITATKRIKPSKELSISYSKLNYYYHLKKIEGSEILDELNSLFFKYGYNTHFTEIKVK